MCDLNISTAMLEISRIGVKSCLPTPATSALIVLQQWLKKHCVSIVSILWRPRSMCLIYTLLSLMKHLITIGTKFTLSKRRMTRRTIHKDGISRRFFNYSNVRRGVPGHAGREAPQ